MGLNGDDLVDEVFQFEMLEVHLVLVLYLLSGASEVVLSGDVGAGLHEEYLGVSLDHDLVVAVFIAEVLFIHAVELIFDEVLVL